MYCMESNAWSRLRDLAFSQRVLPVFLEYKEQRGMLAARPRSRFLPLRPDLFLSPTEHAEVLRHHQRLELLGGEPGVRQSDQWIQLHRRVETIAAGALNRRLGIEPFMVLDVERDDGYRTLLQVLTIGLDRRGSHGLMWWWLRGRALRKDQTLGALPAGIGFETARICRRTLTGAWVPLHPVPMPRRDQHAFRNR